MPRIDFAFLADAAEADSNRKFHVLGGGVDQIGAPGFPVVHPRMSLVMRILVHPAEADRPHRLEVKMVDADGKQLAQINGEFQANFDAPPGREIPLNLVINLMNTRFEEPGDYSIDVVMDDQHAKSLPLRLNVVTLQTPS